MINFNGVIIHKSKNFFNANNRAFKYADALFETVKVENLKIYFLEDHYFRLMASMRMLRMEIPMNFTLEFFESEILKTVTSNKIKNARVRLTVFRKNGGLYTPLTNKIEYVIEALPLNTTIKKVYTVDLFRDYYLYSGILSTLKTTNKITNVLAGIFALENGFDNCILLNEKKYVAETINANIFIVKDNVIKTPPITEGCVKGIIRKKVIEIISMSDNYTLQEIAVSPFELQKADEIFITNAIVGIQPITNYKKYSFSTAISEKLQAELTKLI